MGQEEVRGEAPKYRSVDALSGRVRHHTDKDLDLITACLDDGGHYWNKPDPGDNYQCRRCPMIGAKTGQPSTTSPTS